MSAHAELLDRRPSALPYVEADLNFLGAMTDRPRNYTFEPPPGVPWSNIVSETHRVPIHICARSRRTSRSTGRASNCSAIAARFAIFTTRLNCAPSITPKPNA